MEYYKDSYKTISLIFNDNNKKIMGISVKDKSKLINNINQCHLIFISCKEGEISGIPLDNKCYNSNDVDNCEN